MKASRPMVPARIIAIPISLAASLILWAASAQGDPLFIRTGPLAANAPQDAPPRTPSPILAVGQTSTSLIYANPREQYVTIKRVFGRMVTEVESDGQWYKGSYDITYCGSGYDYMRLPEKYYRGGNYYLLYDVREDPTDTLTDLALHAVYLEKILTKLGYPKSVWQTLLMQFEEEQITLRLREVETGQSVIYLLGWGKTEESLPSEEHYYAFLDELVQRLNSYRQRKAPRLPPVVYEGGCGEGGFGIKVKTEPADGRVMFITVFFYELCKAQRLDPEDLTQCDRWREALADADFEVSGDYFYRATWPDGAERRGRLNFDYLVRDLTITLRKPKVEHGKRTR